MCNYDCHVRGICREKARERAAASFGARGASDHAVPEVAHLLDDDDEREASGDDEADVVDMGTHTVAVTHLPGFGNKDKAADSDDEVGVFNCRIEF